MRYTKRALLVFGLGLVLGFALIVGVVPGFGWIASGIMALGLVGLPLDLRLWKLRPGTEAPVATTSLGETL